MKTRLVTLNKARIILPQMRILSAFFMWNLLKFAISLARQCTNALLADYYNNDKINDKIICLTSLK